MQEVEFSILRSAIASTSHLKIGGTIRFPEGLEDTPFRRLQARLLGFLVQPDYFAHSFSKFYLMTRKIGGFWYIVVRRSI